jgi:hypothetical protein
MLVEVYTGARPGRTRLLLAVCAALLVGTLGLAWVQVGRARALAPEQRVGDTPLWVRPPRGWRPDPRNPQRFILPLAEPGRRGGPDFERRIQFEFLRLPAFQPLEQLLRLPELSDPAEAVNVGRARIGKYDAIEVHRSELRRLGRAQIQRETILRFTCLPRGHLIKVLYEPLLELRPADLEILEDVCATLRVDDPTLSGTPQEYLDRAGLTLPLEDDWTVVGADFQEVPGVYIGGWLDERPAWAIAVLRTWLAPGRTPRALLADLAAQEWLTWDIDPLLSERRRPDGATITTARHPAFGQSYAAMPSAWVLQQSASQAVIMFVCAGTREADPADRVAERIATTLQIAPLVGHRLLAGDMERAVATGLELAEDLRKGGPAPRWGRESIETTYQRLHRDEIMVLRRAATGRNPALGYEGSVWRRIGDREESVAWTIDGRAATYEWKADLFHGRSQLHVIEQRRDPSGEVVRQVLETQPWAQRWEQRQRWTFNPGPAFIPPPTESIVEGWVARTGAAAAIVEVSSPLGPGTHTLLLRGLPPQGDYPRVLVQQDFWPQGLIEVFDDARAETYEEVYPTGTYRRVR